MVNMCEERMHWYGRILLLGTGRSFKTSVKLLLLHVCISSIAASYTPETISGNIITHNTKTPSTTLLTEEAKDVPTDSSQETEPTKRLTTLSNTREQTNHTEMASSISSLSTSGSSTTAAGVNWHLEDLPKSVIISGVIILVMVALVQPLVTWIMCYVICKRQASLAHQVEKYKRQTMLDYQSEIYKRQTSQTSYLQEHHKQQSSQNYLQEQQKRQSNGKADASASSDFGDYIIMEALDTGRQESTGERKRETRSSKVNPPSHQPGIPHYNDVAEANGEDVYAENTYYTAAQFASIGKHRRLADLATLV
ncbi:uncharacterized protein [Apostichopus japonicus]